MCHHICPTYRARPTRGYTPRQMPLKAPEIFPNKSRDLSLLKLPIDLRPELLRVIRRASGSALRSSAPPKLPEDELAGMSRRRDELLVNACS